MASLPFPDTGTRMVEFQSGKPAVTTLGYLFADAELTVVAEAYADVNGAKGALLPTDRAGRRYISTDTYGRQPDYWGPVSGQDRLWIVVNGVASPVDADYNARIDALGERVTAVEAAGGAVASVNTKTGVVVLNADDLTDGTTKKMFLATERTKLTGIATGATANSADATLLARGNHTGTQTADTVTDGTTNKAYTAAEKTKLAAVASGATANATDAQLRDRSTHTGTQATSTVTGLDAALAAKVAKDSLVVNVEDYAVGNANYLSAGVWYADAGLTTPATNDTVAIRALVTAGAKHLTFGSRRYFIRWTEGTTFLGWANANGITIEGHGAALCDTTTYTVSPFNPYTPVFEFDNCTNVKVTGVDYVGPAIASPLVNHGYVGSTFARIKNGCRTVQVDASVTNARYGVESGGYPTETEGYNKHLRINLRCSFVAYPQAHYLAENVTFDIDADDVHRVTYLAGCINTRGVARWKNEYVADTCMLITDAKTGTGTSRGCSDLDVTSIDKGSTVFQPSTTCAGIGLSRVDPGIVYENIKVRVHSTSTDTLSSTVGGFKMYSGAGSLTTPPAPFNWEPSITVRNVEVSGLMDHSAQTIDGNTAGDLFVRAWDTSSAHAATVENLKFTDLILKPSTGNTRGLYIEAPGAIGNGLVVENVQAPGYALNIYTPTTVPLTIRNSAFDQLIGGTGVPRLVIENSTINSVSGTITGYDSLNTSVSGGGAFLRQKTIILNMTSGTAVTWTGALPAGSLPLGVSGVIQQTITGASGILVGVGSDTSRYLNTNTLTAGFTFGPINQAVTEQQPWWTGPSTLNINVLSKGGTFTAGKLKLVLTYFDFPAPTS